MKVFVDSSSLVKMFLKEQGSEKAIRLVDEEAEEIWILDLARVELQSAVLKKYRNKELTQEKLFVVQRAIEDQLDLFNEVYMSNDIVKEAANLIAMFGENIGLRTLDSLHIACWMTYATQDLKFVTSDKIQEKVVSNLDGNIIFIE